jgi:hypothetical protein
MLRRYRCRNRCAILIARGLRWCTPGTGINHQDWSCYTVLSHGDPYAKSRILNFLTRTASDAKDRAVEVVAPTSHAAQLLPLAIEAGQPSEWTVRLCRFRMPSPWPIGQSSDGGFEPPTDSEAPHATLGTGIARNAKDAEIAAVMHAERIVERCGFQLFALPSKQTRHAEEQRKSGRLVALPESDPLAAARLDEIRNSPAPKPVVVSEPLVKQLTSTSASRDLAGGATASVEATTAASVPKDVIRPQRYFKMVPQATAKLVAAKAPSKIEVGGDAERDIEITLDEDGGDDGPPAGAANDVSHSTAHRDLLGVTPYPSDPRKAGDARAHSVDWRCWPRYTPHQRTHPLREREDESERGKFWLVDIGNEFQGDPHALLSPHLPCSDSVERVRDYFTFHGRDFDADMQVVPYCKPAAFDRAGPDDVVSCTVPLPGVQGVVAQGVASSRKLATVFAAMHAELLIDHLGKRIYPADELKQRLHADACYCAGRWASCTAADETLPQKLRHDEQMPRPLREWGGATERKEQGGRRRMQSHRVAPLTADEGFISMHHQMVACLRNHCLDANPDDVDEELIAALRQFCVDRGEAREAFFLNMDYSSQWRCTFLLPLPLKEYGLRGGYAVATSAGRARLLCARHAVETLCHLGIALYSDRKRQQEFDDRRRDSGLLVYPRDYTTGALIGAPVPALTRSPPSMREHGPLRPITPQLELDSVMWMNADRFDVAELAPEDIVLLRQATAEYFARAVKRPAPMPMNVFYGMQPVKGRLAAPSNTAWFPLPLPTSTPGAPVATLAVGRGTTRRHAERMAWTHTGRCIIHATRMHKGDPISTAWRQCPTAAAVDAWHERLELKHKTNRSAAVWPLADRHALDALGFVPRPVMDTVIASRCDDVAGR